MYAWPLLSHYLTSRCSSVLPGQTHTDSIPINSCLLHVVGWVMQTPVLGWRLYWIQREKNPQKKKLNWILLKFCHKLFSGRWQSVGSWNLQRIGCRSRRGTDCVTVAVCSRLFDCGRSSVEPLTPWDSSQVCEGMSCQSRLSPPQFPFARPALLCLRVRHIAQHRRGFFASSAFCLHFYRLSLHPFLFYFILFFLFLFADGPLLDI